MSIPNTYRHKSTPVEAVQLTRKNVNEVAKWCGGKVVERVKPGDPSDVYIALDLPSTGEPIRAETFHWSTHDGRKYNGGEYVVRDDNGAFHAVSPVDFEAEYEIPKRGWR